MNRELGEKEIKPGRRIQLIEGDLTEERVDAIVNAANCYLQHGGGVAGAIVRKGGEIIQEESNQIGYVPVGEAAVTSGGKLPARYVIHAVGPRWGEGDEEDKLRRAVRQSLKIATERGFRSVSFPAISSGIFGFPRDRCARIMLDTIIIFLEETREISLSEVRICLYDPQTQEAFLAIF